MRQLFTRSTGPLHGFYANAFLGYPGTVFSGDIGGDWAEGYTPAPEWRGSVYDLMAATGKSARELLEEVGSNSRQIAEEYGSNVVQLARAAGGGFVELSEYMIDALKEVALGAEDVPVKMAESGAKAVDSATGNMAKGASDSAGWLFLGLAALGIAIVASSD